MMERMNSPAEIGRRVVYLLYVASVLAYIFSCVGAVGQTNVRSITLCCAAFAAASALRYAGYRWLEFSRLSQSFPAGCSQDAVPQSVRTEVEALVHEFHAPGTDWVRRAAIRRHLVELEEQVPELADAYEDELRGVLAA